MAYHKILVACDLSSGNEKLLHRAATVAAQDGCSVILMHAIEIDPAAEHIFVDQQNYRDTIMQQVRDRLADLMANFPDLPIDQQKVEFGPARKTILNIAKQSGCDLIIVGSHGQHGWQYLLGSTANSTLHSANCDVLVVRETE